MQIAKAAIATLGQKDPLAHHSQIGDHRLFVFIKKFRADRHPQHNLGAIRPSTLFAHARRAIFGEKMLLIAKIDQGVEPLDRLGPDRAAIATVAAVRTAVFKMLFAQETHGPPATGTGSNMDFGQI